MMGKVSERLNRILLMVPFILSANGASVSDLCEKFEVDREELIGDLDTLRMCGVPDYTPADLIDYRIEGDRVYLMMADFFSRPLHITREEAFVLFIAGRALISAGLFEKESPLGTALEKVEKAISKGEGCDAREMAARIDVEMSSYTGRWREIIEEGLEKQQRLRVEYYSYSKGKMTRRQIDPLSLIWSRGYWYLLAWCHQARDTRLFRLDRMKSIKLAGEPAEWTHRPFNMPELVGEYKPGKKAHNVRLEFSGKEGRRLVEEWPAARVTEGDAGILEVELRTRNLEWLSNYLLKFGDRVRVRSPRELERMLRDNAKALLEEYG